MRSEDADRVAPALSVWAAVIWALLGVVLLPLAVTQAIAINEPGGFERGNFLMLLPLAPIVCAIESGFHVRRFWMDRKVWASLDPTPLRSPLWWLQPFPRPLGRTR